MNKAYSKKERIIISLGGSLLVPEGIDAEFIGNFKKFVVSHIKKGYRFILVTGGGRIARQYIDVAGQITKITDEDRDWLGIHATRMNAHLVRTVFREYAHPRIRPTHMISKISMQRRKRFSWLQGGVLDFRRTSMLS